MLVQCSHVNLATEGQRDARESWNINRAMKTSSKDHKDHASFRMRVFLKDTKKSMWGLVFVFFFNCNWCGNRPEFTPWTTSLTRGEEEDKANLEVTFVSDSLSLDWIYGERRLHQGDAWMPLSFSFHYLLYFSFHPPPPYVCLVPFVSLESDLSIALTFHYDKTKL